jgi:hypothetical protein
MVPGKSPGSDWRYVMPANCDLIQYINPDTHPTNPKDVASTGPMTIDPGFAAVWVDAWVVQGGSLIEDVTHTGPSQSTDQSTFPTQGRWTAPNRKWRNGKFQGNYEPALGISLLATRSTEGEPHTYQYYWWYDIVLLKN